MGVKYLLDTNILSELSKNRPNKQVINMVEKCSDQCATASLVIHEINYGINRLPESTRKSNLTLFLKQLENYHFPVLPYSNACAVFHAYERARLTSIGLTPSFVDVQIAAVARTNKLVLVTRNVSDFSKYHQLNIENWFVH